LSNFGLRGAAGGRNDPRISIDKAERIGLD
jgi:hypothetical protein